MFKTALILTVLAVAAVASAKPQAPERMPNSIGCSVCKLGFSSIERWIKSNKTETEIEDLLGQLCNILPDEFRDACRTVVDTEIKELIEIATEIESPEEVCIQLGACDDPLPVPDPECAMCQYLIKDLERWVEENKTMSEIEHLVEAVCTIMPSSWQPACKTVADMGIDKIVELIMKYENPKVVCEQLNICDGTYSSSMAAFKCEACEVVFDALEKWVASNASETEIEFLFEKLCSILPDSGKEICDKIMTIGIKEAIAMLEEVESPFEICRQLGACIGPDPEPVKCHICKFLMEDIESWLASGKTVADIEALLDNICELMGEGWADVCETIEHTTVQKLIDMVVKYENPEVVCTQIELCGNGSSEIA